jgi:hypothetical protein
VSLKAEKLYFVDDEDEACEGATVLKFNEKGFGCLAPVPEPPGVLYLKNVFQLVAREENGVVMVYDSKPATGSTQPPRALEVRQRTYAPVTVTLSPPPPSSAMNVRCYQIEAPAEGTMLFWELRGVAHLLLGATKPDALRANEFQRRRWVTWERTLRRWQVPGSHMQKSAVLKGKGGGSLSDATAPWEPRNGKSLILRSLHCSSSCSPS